MSRTKTVLLGAIAGVVLAALALGLIQRRELPMRFNYEVNMSGMIVFIRPDIPEERATLIGIIQLPPQCWDAEISCWNPGEWGRVAFGERMCRVERNIRWDPEETAEHYARITEKIRRIP